MPQQEALRLYSTFNKGLITEASPLTFPQDATYNEDNCVIYYKGNRVRRLGINYEDSFSLTGPAITKSTINANAIKEFKWSAVANSDLDFLVVQVGLVLYFWDITSDPISSGYKSFTQSLSSFIAPFSNSTLVAASEVSMTSGNGILFVTGDQIEPFYITYTAGTDSISATRIYLLIRDFSGLGDSLAPDDEPATLTDRHRYNLKNQGWNTPTNNNTNGTVFGASSDPISGVRYYDINGQPQTYSAPGDAPIQAYLTDQHVYPPNNKQWWVGVNSTGGLDTNVLRNYSAGNTYAPRGHFILDQFNKDRAAVCDPSMTLPVQTLNYRPISNTFFAGRVWYLAGSTIYFTQVLDTGTARQAGMCFQQADPTDQSINQLVNSDGGVIPIPELGTGVKIYPTGTGVLIFGSNGVWFIGGGTNGFSATDYTVSKISPIGMNSPNSVVAIDSDIYWWSDIGIQGMSQKTGIFGPIQNNFDKLNISDTTIKTFYFTQINSLSKQYVKGAYDPANNCIVWLFKSSGNTDYYQYDRILTYDLTSKAFYPWTISSVDSLGWICGVFKRPTLFENTAQINDRRNTYLCYLTLASSNASNFRLTFSYFRDNNFTDWVSANGTGLSYTSFMETGYELLAVPAGDKAVPDAFRKKVAPRLVVYFSRTEQNFVGSGGNYTLDRPSSCLLTVKWDWSSSAIANKWMGPFEVYRLSNIPSPDETNLAFDNGYPITIFREKIRGSGRAIQFRFESNGIGKDFNLFGWGVEYSTNGRL